eukprot:CAMPEP_0197026926 /NCGR_PEP_ID=MMETSP1384-20130603/6933_1 /TAXON_ID=29189 /ORGANISM="Ammonia sp." /LENGTH=381 /DNA_ID=CAMNT_0042455699 /DNA_START=28 /DNA_END=1169 /DNA_ORIENTATION=+
MDKRQRFLPKGGTEHVDSDDDLYEDPNHHVSNAPDLAPHQAAINSVNAVELNQSNSSVRNEREYTVLTHSNDADGGPNVIKIHTLNLNNRKQRSILLAMLLFIWCIPTLILSLDFYQESDSQQVPVNFSMNQNKLHITSMVLLLTACILLLGFEVVEFRHSVISSLIGCLFIIGGCLHFAATVMFAHHHCYNSRATHIDDATGYCYVGYLGSSNLAFMLPVLLGFDILCCIMNNKYVRIVMLSFVLWLSTLCAVMVISKYGNNFEDDFPSLMFVMDSKLFTILCIGWWMLCVTHFVAMSEVLVCIYVLHLHKFKFDRLYMKLFNVLIGFVLILSVSFILIDKDACITGEPLSGDFFCYYKLIYVLVGLTCVVAYEMQTLSG